MSTGKLKAQYNRVRTSVALQGNDMWSRTIGIESEKGTNSAIEAQIRAPEIKGGGRQAKREAAQALLKDFGMEESICDYAGLLKLAKAQGNVGHATRGACKICGQLGHLTKQCKNYLSEFYQQEKQEVEHQAAVAQAAAEAKQGEDDLSELSGLSDLSDSDDERRSKKKRKASGDPSSNKHRKEKSRSKSKHRKEKKHKSKSKSKSKSRKEKRSRSSDSD